MIDIDIHRDQEFTHVAVYDNNVLIFVKTEILIIGKYRDEIKTMTNDSNSSLNGTLLSRTMDINRDKLRENKRRGLDEIEYSQNREVTRRE